MPTTQQDVGVAAALAGHGTGLAQVPTPDLPFGITPESVAWLRGQFEEATKKAVADGIEEGTKRAAEKYGTYATIGVVSSAVTAVAAVAILIAILVKDS